MRLGRFVLAWVVMGGCVACSRPGSGGATPPEEAQTVPAERGPETGEPEEVVGLPGVHFEIALVEGRDTFQMGERIQVELRFSSSRPQTYELDAATYDRGGRLHSDTYEVSPAEGWVDPLADYFDSGFGEMGGLRATPVLEEKPYTITRDLNEYVRFTQPGMYTLVVDSARIQSQSADGQVLWNQSVRSNPITIHIQPAEAAWQQTALDGALALMDDVQKVEEERLRGARVLRFLGSEAAARAMAERFRDDRFLHDVMFGLFGSPHRALVVEVLSQRLVAPDAGVTTMMLYTVARLEARLEAPEMLGPYPHDGSQDARDAWQKASKAHQERVQKHTMAHAERVMAALSDKTEAARAQSLATLFELVQSWASTADPPDLSAFSALGPELTSRFEALSPELQGRLLGYFWRHLDKNEAFAQVLLRMFDNMSLQEHLRATALGRYYELEPAAGRALIVEEIKQPKHILNSANVAVLLSLPEAELPELDGALATRLETQTGYDASILAVSLVERYASSAIADRVEAVYVGLGDPALRFEERALAYLLRVKPERGEMLLRKRVGANAEVRFHDLMARVALIRADPRLEALAIEVLEHENAHFVVGAAKTLAIVGGSAGKAALWERMELWHGTWKDRAADLGPHLIGEHPHAVEIALERALWQSLARARGWTLTREEGERLQTLVVSASEKQQAGHAVDHMQSPVNLWITYRGSGERDIRLGHVEFDSLDALDGKLSQLPEGTQIALTLWNASESEETVLRAKLDAMFEAHALQRFEPPH